MIRLFNLVEQKEMGGVLENQGSVNVIESCKSHALTGTEQGTIGVWRCKDWTNLHAFKGHRKAITGLALHPSSRMAISTGKDKRLYLWNLIKARPVFKYRTDQVLEELIWSPCGYFFIARTGSEVRYFNVECNFRDEFVKFKHTSQLVNIGFMGRSDCVFAADYFGEIVMWKLGNGCITFKASESRLSRACFIEVNERKIIVTASTLGEIAVWNVTAAVASLMTSERNTVLQIENAKDMLVFSINLKCRCSALVVTQ